MRRHLSCNRPAPAPADVPGHRDEPLFSSRITKFNAVGPACPLLFDDRCSVYLDRPMLCRAYGFPVDAYAVQSNDSIVFRSLCVLYEGHQLTDYVRAKQLKTGLTDLSGNFDVSLFASASDILLMSTGRADAEAKKNSGAFRIEGDATKVSALLPAIFYPI